MSLTWAYGITTVPERFLTTLPKTLKSLEAAGFPEPRLFIDGNPHHLDGTGYLNRYRATYRMPRSSPMANWYLGAAELYMRNANADLFAMFQDDFVTYPNLREYLESCDYPQSGYWNLYTFPANEKPEEGWYLSNQRGLGAVALVFDNKTLRLLLGNHHFIDRIKDKTPKGTRKRPRGEFAIDGGIVWGLRDEGVKEYVHNPSLVQHIGHESIIGNGVHEQASTFLGADYDARHLINKPPTVHTDTGERRIGLVGFNAPTGIGELNRQICDHLPVDRWLIKPHGTYRVGPLHPDVDSIVCPSGNSQKLEQFLKSIDVVLFVETPYYENLLELAKRRKKRIVCIPMVEWCPPARRGWTSQVDQFICPTKQAYDLMSKEVPCKFVPWPVDIDRFPFQQRKICERFLFLNGNGGWQGRKGGSVIKRALHLWPEMPLVYSSQKGGLDLTGPNITRINSTSEASALYHQGDVLLYPASVDGLALQPREAMSCGLPVISTNGEPWNELPALERLSSTSRRQMIRRMMDWHDVSPEDLVKTCQLALETDLTEESQQARQWAELNRWSIKGPELEELIKAGNHRIRIPFPKEVVS